MTERKVLIVRVKGGMQIAQGVTNYIMEGLVRGVLALPEDVITSYAVEDFPALGVENEDTIYTVVSEGVQAITIYFPLARLYRCRRKTNKSMMGKPPQPPHRSRRNQLHHLSQRGRWRRSNGRFLYGCKPTSRERNLAGHRECLTPPAVRWRPMWCGLACWRRGTSALTAGNSSERRWTNWRRKWRNENLYSWKDHGKPEL